MSIQHFKYFMNLTGCLASCMIKEFLANTYFYLE